MCVGQMHHCTTPVGTYSNGTLPPLVVEYEAFVARVRRRDNPAHAPRARRSEEPTASSYPFTNILTAPGNLSAAQHYVVGLAYKLLGLFIPHVDAPIENVTIQTSENTIDAGNGEVVVGSADMGSRTVTLYVCRILICIPNTLCLCSLCAGTRSTSPGSGRFSRCSCTSFFI